MQVFRVKISRSQRNERRRIIYSLNCPNKIVETNEMSKTIEEREKKCGKHTTQVANEHFPIHCEWKKAMQNTNRQFFLPTEWIWNGLIWCRWCRWWFFFSSLDSSSALTTCLAVVLYHWSQNIYILSVRQQFKEVRSLGLAKLAHKKQRIGKMKLNEKEKKWNYWQSEHIVAEANAPHSNNKFLQSNLCKLWCVC